MAAGKGPGIAVLTMALLLSACGGQEDGSRLMNLRAPGNGPDEFAILPSKPLQMPSDLKNLPTPQPGAANLVDQNPLDDAVLALGGRPGAGSNDAALVAATGRYGASGGIREQLAAEDAEFRSRQSPKLLERLFGKSSYYNAYSQEATSADEELERWRRAGARTPSAPPEDDR